MVSYHIKSVKLAKHTSSHVTIKLASCWIAINREKKSMQQMHVFFLNHKLSEEDEEHHQQ